MRQHALDIWIAGVDAVRPRPLMLRAWRELGASDRSDIDRAPRILVVGCGKAGAKMAVGLEDALAHRLNALTGLVNVPEGSSVRTQCIRLHPARPAASNFPTAEGVAGADEMLALLAGVVALFGLGLTGWAQGIVATGAFLGVAVLTRAVPPEVFDALARRRAGRS